MRAHTHTRMRTHTQQASLRAKEPIKTKNHVWATYKSYGHLLSSWAPIGLVWRDADGQDRMETRKTSYCWNWPLHTAFHLLQQQCYTHNLTGLKDKLSLLSFSSKQKFTGKWQQWQQEHFSCNLIFLKWPASLLLYNPLLWDSSTPTISRYATF